MMIGLNTTDTGVSFLMFGGRRSSPVATVQNYSPTSQDEAEKHRAEAAVKVSNQAPHVFFGYHTLIFCFAW